MSTARRPPEHGSRPGHPGGAARQPEEGEPPGRRGQDAPSDAYDVVVIGAGVVGAAIARELSGHDLSVALVDAHDDVGNGTSKANTAILHTGFDAAPGSLEARLVRRGHTLLGDYAAATGIALERTGALMVAWTEEERAALPALREKALRNGYDRCALLTADEVRARLPHLGAGALGGLAVPDEAVVCPWSVTLALATDARARGTRLLLGRRVEGVTGPPGHGGPQPEGAPGAGTTLLHTSRGPLTTRWTVNAAGLGSDHVDAMFGHHRFTVTPRRGQLLVYDTFARRLAGTIVLPVPTARGKGVLIAPTVHGNVLLGPTAEDLEDRTATRTTADGFAHLLAKGERLLPALVREEVVAAYAGLRAATEHEDYVIAADPERRYAVAGGIRSTGLSASMAIAEHVRALLVDAGLRARPRTALPAPPRVPSLGATDARPHTDAALIARDPAYGRIVCFCERVTEGEIRDACRGPVPPAGLDGLRRRTRATSGRCQGHACAPEVTALLDAYRAPRPSGPAPSREDPA